MAYVPNFDLPGKDHLLLLINGSNDKAYTFAEIDFDPPEVSLVEVGPNTQCIVRALPGSGYKGSALVYYNRLDMNAVFTGLMDLALDPGATLNQVLAQIDTQYGLTVTVDDVTLADIVGVPTLTAKVGSYLFVGAVSISYTGAVNPPVGDPLQITGYNGVGLTGYDGQTLSFYAA